MQIQKHSVFGTKFEEIFTTILKPNWDHDFCLFTCIFRKQGFQGIIQTGRENGSNKNLVWECLTLRKLKPCAGENKISDFEYFQAKYF